MESYRVLGEHVHVCLFLDFHEGAKLKSRLITAAGLDGTSGDAERERVNFAFIDASLILSPLHLRTAVQQALLAKAGDVLRTKTVHSEILYALHPSHNISDAIRRFGVSDQTRSLLVVRVGNIDSYTGSILTDEELRLNMESVVQGRAAGLDENLSHITDFSQIHKVYKTYNSGSGPLGRSSLDIQDYVISLVASKSVLS